jgi:hypothetical protein
VISSINLTGFRAFRERQVAELAPLTLVYGPNSAGKSSLVRSLLLLQQSVLFSHSPVPLLKGRLVDLGHTRAVAHLHQGVASLGLLIKSDALDGVRDVEVTFDLDSRGHQYDLVRIAPEGFEPIVFERFGTSGDWLNALVLAAASQNPFEALESKWYGGSLPLEHGSTATRPVFTVENLLPGEVIGRLDRRSFQRVGPAERTSAEARWGQFGSSLISSFRDELERVSYLGPLRRPWERSEQLSQDDAAGGGVGSSGQHALGILARRSDILARVNQDLAELETSYELQVDLRGSDFDELGDFLPLSVVPVLKHRESGVRVSPVDAGFGLSQLLPIVIEMSVREKTLICIEQPELHLHPRLQARMGQLLWNAIRGGNENRFLIETHSEHLLLRIRKLIRQNLLDPEMVRVLYVDNQEFDRETESYYASSESSIHTIEIDAEGDFVDPWPGGFFEDRLHELPGWDG